MVRSAYGIGNKDECFDDCILSVFCTCCVVNQLYQTTAARGNPTTDGGTSFNVKLMPQDAQSNTCIACLESFCCMPCTTATMLEDSMGMPWFLGLCCTNFFVARNFIRYQFRYKPVSSDDCMEECLLPTCTYYIGGIIANCLPCIYCVICGGLVALVMNLKSAVEAEKSKQPPPGKGYLIGYRQPTGGRSPPLPHLCSDYYRS